MAKTILTQLVIKDEVRKALMFKNSFTTLCKDAFQPFFYKKNWDQAGDSILKLVRDAFALGRV